MAKKTKPAAKPAAKPAVKAMTKAEMITAISETTGFTKVCVEEVYNAVIALTAVETKKAGAFTLPGLGKFVVVQRQARKGRNPATGEEMEIPAKPAVKFTVSKLVKDKILAD
jgi:DNA-binding protein HU-beta